MQFRKQRVVVEYLYRLNLAPNAEEMVNVPQNNGA
jgi:hypothetical protein